MNDFYEAIEHLTQRKIISVDVELPENVYKIIAPKKNFDELGLDFSKHEQRKS